MAHIFPRTHSIHFGQITNSLFAIFVRIFLMIIIIKMKEPSITNERNVLRIYNKKLLNFQLILLLKAWRQTMSNRKNNKKQYFSGVKVAYLIGIKHAMKIYDNNTKWHLSLTRTKKKSVNKVAEFFFFGKLMLMGFIKRYEQIKRNTRSQTVWVFGIEMV